MSNINISGSPAVVSAFRLFDGDSAITIHRDGDVELGPAWANAGDAATAFFNELTEHAVPSWGARMRALEAALSWALIQLGSETGYNMESPIWHAYDRARSVLNGEK